MLADVLPKNDLGNIILDPAGKNGDKMITGEVITDIFTKLFPNLASAETPLTDALYNQLCAIDEFWKTNAEAWRASNLI